MERKAKFQSKKNGKVESQPKEIEASKTSRAILKDQKSEISENLGALGKVKSEIKNEKSK